MSKYYILFNPYASNGNGGDIAKSVKNHLLGEELEFKSMTEISDYHEFFASIGDTDRIVICGGDGTLNRFANDCNAVFPENDIYLFPVGTGNDFLLDLGYKGTCGPVLINKYLKNLPWVIVNDKKYYFIDNVAYGIDGWVCEIADIQKAKNPNVKVNYTTIAISGLLGKYKPCNAKVTVDGKEYSYKNVWMAPSMNGRYFGGGMMVTPMQDRLNPDNTITLMLFQDGSRFEIATGFPKIFGGKHVNNKHAVFHTGHDITVEYDEPRAVQIDGETILGVTKYRAGKN